MRWQGNRESENVEDRRGASPGLMVGGLGTLVILVLGLFLGVNPATLMRVVQVGGQVVGGGGGEAKPDESPEGKKMGDFVRTVLADTEDVWTGIFQQEGKTYRKPSLVLYRGSTDAKGCGMAQSAIGPFYCPPDEKVYLDTGFFQEMVDKFDAPADSEFAQAYVIAHEIGHHIQKLMGRTEKMEQMRSQMSKTEYNEQSVRLELQADFYAGVWAHHADQARGILERGRRGGGIGVGPQDRRRRAPEKGARVRRARLLHPRHVRAAGKMVPQGPGDRRRAAGGHLLGSPTLEAVSKQKGTGSTETLRCLSPRNLVAPRAVNRPRQFPAVNRSRQFPAVNRSRQSTDPDSFRRPRSRATSTARVDWIELVIAGWVASR